MKILLIDNTSSFLDFALRCQSHEVRVWMGTDKRGDRSKVGDGMITKIPDWRQSMKWADIIILSDNVKYMAEIETYRKAGFPIFNGHREVSEWELNRGTGQRIFEKCGIPIIPAEIFSNYDKAIAFVEKNMKRYVSKPSGDADKALTYVSKGPKDMISMLERWKKLSKLKAPFLMQEFIHGGIEMAVSGYFGPSGFNKHFLENFEFKKLMNDDFGQATGESGTCLKYVTESKLADMVLKPLAPELFRQGYNGFIDVSVMIDSKGTPWPLEHTCARFGWPLFQIQQELHPEPVEWMLDCIDGFDSFKPSTKTATGVVVAMPDYPYTTFTKKEVSGFPIWNLTDKNRSHVHLAEVMIGEGVDEENGKIVRKKMPVTAGDYVYIASGVADTIKKSAENAYKIIDEIELSNSPIVRTDIGKRLEKQLPELQKHGFATSWRYE